MSRLTLNPTGIKSPLEVGTAQPGDPIEAQAEAKASPSPRARKPPRSQAAPKKPAAEARKSASAQAPAFYGGGYPVQTSIALDVQLIDRARELAWAAAVSFTTLVVATLQRDLPASSQDAIRLAVLERADHAPSQRAERNVRLPGQLRVRLDELIGSEGRAARVTRADLVNALLRAHLPETAEATAALCAAYARQQALSSLRAA
jgi:Arc/MetJ-type ribon-helix-helix transcriptional regulator